MNPRRWLVHRVVAAAGGLTRLFPPESARYRRVFLPAYFAYKRHLEDPFAALVANRPDLFRGGDIFDIGANVGYTTTLFAAAADPGARVVAFEPDETNFAVLTDLLQRRGLAPRVEAVRSAVGAAPGRVPFWRNEAHQGDHRVFSAHLARTGREARTVTEVPLTSLDAFRAAQAAPGPVAFIKIDVQGYEPAVCEGMTASLAAHPAAVIAVEFSPADLHDQGHDPGVLPAFFRDRGYRAHPLRRRGPLRPVAEADLPALAAAHGYVDLLFSRRRLEGGV